MPKESAVAERWFLPRYPIRNAPGWTPCFTSRPLTWVSAAALGKSLDGPISTLLVHRSLPMTFAANGNCMGRAENVRSEAQG
jgi:hypothetical protein